MYDTGHLPAYQGLHFDSPNLQDSFNVALSQMVLQMSHIGQHLHAR